MEKGGTWIAANRKGSAGVLLNGAGKKHIPVSSYRYSRGLVLPQILVAEDPVEAFQKLDSIGLEPFTLVLYVGKRLYEGKWDGAVKSLDCLPEDQPRIWSSITLYSDEVHEKRKNWFYQWLKANPIPDAESIFKLHRYGGEGEPEIDFVMKPANEMGTVSITSIELGSNSTLMNYHPIVEDKVYRSRLYLSDKTK